MTSKPFFSVVIPLYNKAPHVARSVGSVLSQTFQDFELIIVNDASTDGSVEEVRKFNDPRIRLLHRDTPGPGGYAARNLGIKEARAEWVAFLDADDYWEEYHLKAGYDIILRFPKHQFISFSYRSCRDDEYTIKGVDSERVASRHSALCLFAEADIFHTNAVIVSKAGVLKAGGFPVGRYRRGGDNDLWLRLILTLDGTVFSPIVTSNFQKNNSTVTKQISNIGHRHPIIETIVEYDSDEKRTQADRAAIRRLANRKSFAWSLNRKRARCFRIVELRNFYPSAFSLKDLILCLLLLLPSWFYRSLRPGHTDMSE